MSRAISDQFVKDLREGSLAGVLEEVHNDNSLIMELRGDRVIIYYRGGALFTITERGNGNYVVRYNCEYCSIRKKYPDIVENPSLEDCVRYIAFYKNQMDFHMANADQTLEKECQHNIVLENNVLGDSKGDYLFLDIEYVYEKARFDMVALKWPSISSVRKKTNNLGISFIEVKYYDKAMPGDSGIEKHISDYLDFIKSDTYKDMCSDMEKVFFQKCELGLIPAYTKKRTEKKFYEITINPDDVDYIFIFANRDPDSSLAKRELSKAVNSFGKDAVRDIYVAKSSEMGYVLFRYDENGKIDRYIPITEYVQK